MRGKATATAEMCDEGKARFFGIESLEGIPDALSLKMKKAEAKAYKILKFLNEVTVTSIKFFSDFKIS